MNFFYVISISGWYHFLKFNRGESYDSSSYYIQLKTKMKVWFKKYREAWFLIISLISEVIFIIYKIIFETSILEFIDQLAMSYPCTMKRGELRSVFRNLTIIKTNLTYRVSTYAYFWIPLFPKSYFLFIYFHNFAVK